MDRLIAAGCALALGLLTPSLGAQAKAADNPAARKLNRDIPRHKAFLTRIEQSQRAADAERSVEQIAAGITPINEELKKETPDINRLNALVRNLEQQRGTVPAAKLNPKIAEINAIIAQLDDGKTVFYQDIGQEFLD